MRYLLIIFCLCLFQIKVGAQSSFNVVDFGAIADGKTVNTAAMQKAIDAANKKGGIVVVPKGVFLTGSIYLKSNVELNLQEGAVLLGSTSLKDYQKGRWYALLLAKNEKNISLTGKGIIDGQGAALAADVLRLVQEGSIIDPLSHNRPDEKNRPQIIEFTSCDNIRIKDITLKNAACWVEVYNKCSNLTIDNLTVESTAYWNNDGMDIVDCDKVKISNCNINSADDGICLKSSDPKELCQNVEITNCKLRTSASALKFGTPSQGGFKNIVARGLYVYDNYRTAIALEMVDGGVLQDIRITDVIAKNSGGALFIRLGQRKKEKDPGVVKNVYIGNIKAEVPLSKPDSGYAFEGHYKKGPHNAFPSVIAGLPGFTIDDITLENIEIDFSGASGKEIAVLGLDKLKDIPEKEGDYPEYSMFGELPAWGFYIRHASGIKMKNVKLSYKEKDTRPAIVCDDVKGLDIDALTVKSMDELPVIYLNNVKKDNLTNIILPVKDKKAIIKN
ncbi:glycoside hydrolase family 28 protein [Parasediminibacterium sp. JCM 36343]|uniref:glycoside hydrolase family 28 protein n=1 Tax=Parasediminibacterium sp. JCM 36343 TaxID=3374279 RepID=UPI00397B33A9